jgi:ferredoxin
LITRVVYYNNWGKLMISQWFEAGAMKIRINKAMCVGNARCAAVAPQLFPLDDDGYISVEEIEVPAGMEELARRGAKACPERIIVIEE